jgi:segregation and condensation protein B
MSSRKRKNREERSAKSEPEVEAIVETEEPAAAQRRGKKRTASNDAEPAVVSQIRELRPRGGSPAEPELAENEAEEALEDESEDDTAPATRPQLKRAIESLVFVSDQVITAQQLSRLLKTKLADVRELIAELCLEYEGRGIELVEINGGYQFRSSAASAPYVRELVAARPARLTRAQLETLALIAYRQPITRPEIDDVRGVDSGSAIKVLCERDLVKILGRKEEAGRPLLYGTTPYFLEFFSMSTMRDLPTLREFTELTEEHRDLFQKKTGEIPDLSAPSESTTNEAQLEPEPESAAEAVEDDAVASEPTSSEDVSALEPDEES